MKAIDRNRNVSFVVGAFVVGLAIALISTSPKRSVPEVDVTQAKAMIDAGAVVVDVRETHVSTGSHIPGALLIPLGMLAQRMAESSIDKTKPIVVYCNEGTARGPDGTATLQQAGYANAVNLKSGIEGWRAAGLPTTATN